MDELDEIRERKREAILNREESPPDTSPEEPVEVESDGHLDELVEGNGVVVVDFYADWCGPCKMLEPILERVADETDAVVAAVDIDRHQALAGRNGVRGVPTLLLYADGEPVERLVGVQEEARLRELVERHA